MPQSCCVHKCSSISISTSGVVFYNFPREEKRKRIWFDAIGKLQYIGRGTMICSKHFKPSDFEQGSKRLNIGAVPSQQLPPKRSERDVKECPVTQIPNDVTGNKNLRMVVEPSENGRHFMAKLVYLSPNHHDATKLPSGQPRKILPKVVPPSALSTSAINALYSSIPTQLKTNKSPVVPNNQTNEKATNAKRKIKLEIPDWCSSGSDSMADYDSMFEDDDDIEEVFVDDEEDEDDEDIDDDMDIDDEVEEDEDDDFDIYLKSELSEFIECSKDGQKKNRSERISSQSPVAIINSPGNTDCSSNLKGSKIDGKIQQYSNSSSELNPDKDKVTIAISSAKIKKKLSEDGSAQSSAESRMNVKTFSSCGMVKGWTHKSTTLMKDGEVLDSPEAKTESNNDTNKTDKNNLKFGKPYVLLSPLSGDPVTCYVMSQGGTSMNQYVATAAASPLITPNISNPLINSTQGHIVANQNAPNIQLHNISTASTTQPKPTDVQKAKIQPNEPQAKLISNLEKKYNGIINSMKSRLIKRRRSVRSLCQKARRLSKKLESCKTELNDTRSELFKLESESVTWNNTNMSDLGKLIYSLHVCKGKRSAKLAQSVPVPPEVKGFVISLFLTSPRAYHILRDCFNGLPHPKTIAKWLSGDKPVEDTKDVKDKVLCSTKEPSLDETFTNVIQGAMKEHSSDNHTSLTRDIPIEEDIGTATDSNPHFRSQVSNPLNMHNAETSENLRTVIAAAGISNNNEFSLETVTETNTINSFAAINEAISVNDYVCVNDTRNTLDKVDDMNHSNVLYNVISESSGNSVYNVEPCAISSIEDVNEANSVYPSAVFNVEGVNESTVYDVGLSKQQALYFVMDEDGNMTGQLCNPADVVFCSDSVIDEEIDLNQVPHHEVIIE